MVHIIQLLRFNVTKNTLLLLLNVNPFKKCHASKLDHLPWHILLSAMPSQRRSSLKGSMLFPEFKKFPQFIWNFRKILMSVLWQSQQLFWNCSDWTLPSAFWKIRPCLWGQWPLRLLLWYFRTDAWHRRNQAIWKTRFNFCEADRDIWTSIRVHRRHRHHILLHMLLCNQTNRQLIW